MDEVEEAMLALEDAADQPMGWLIDPHSVDYFVHITGMQRDARMTAWLNYHHRLEAQRARVPTHDQLHYRILRRYAELRDAPNPAYHGRKKRTP